MKNRIFGNGDGQQQTMRPSKEVPETYIGNAKKSLDYEHYALRMIRRYGPFISLGKQHWKWNGNIWKPIDFDRFRKQAVRIQPPGTRSCLVTDNILKMMTNLTQVDPDETKWKGAIRIENEAISISLLNGVLRVPFRLAAANLVEPNEKDLVTGELPIEYNPKAKCPTFDYLLASALPRLEDRYMLQCFAGYCLLPDHRFQCVLYCYGKANSGKSLLTLEGIGSMFENLMSNVSLDDICKGGDELRSIEKALVNISTEINSKKLEDSSIFNQIACGEPLNKALKWEKGRRLVPNAKHIFIGNHLPRWERGSDAQTRRIKILYFPNDFTQETKDGSLRRKVKLEGAGIFNWALIGLREVLGLDQMPMGSDESKLHAEQFKMHNNPLGTFNHLFCDFVIGGRLDAKVYGRLFGYWCDCEGIANYSRDTTRLLKRLNPHIRRMKTSKKGVNQTMLLGIELNEKGKKLMAINFT